MPADNRLCLQQPGGRIADEKLGVAAVDLQHLKALVACLIAEILSESAPSPARSPSADMRANTARNGSGSLAS
jgi:hypothetical protein